MFPQYVLFRIDKISERVPSWSPNTPSKNIFLFRSLLLNPYVSIFNSGCSSLIIRPNGSKLAIKCPLILYALISIIALTESLAASCKSNGLWLSSSLLSSKIKSSNEKLFFLIFFLGAQLGPSRLLSASLLFSFKPSKKSFHSFGNEFGSLR